MVKHKKKRNKSYSGRDAAITRPSVTRINAVHRNPAHQWWYDHKRIAKPALIAVAIVTVVAVCIYEIVRLSIGA